MNGDRKFGLVSCCCLFNLSIQFLMINTQSKFILRQVHFINCKPTVGVLVKDEYYLTTF